jgi:hypothetical protein
MEAREIRRQAGLLHARLPELQLGQVPDPRHPQWCRWKLPPLLRLGVTGVIAGCHGLAEVEQFSRDMTPAARGLLGISRRVPDTTLRDAYVTVPPTPLRDCLERQCLAAHRRKALTPHRLPFGMVAMDGKATAGDGWDDHYAQKQRHAGDGGASGVVRTITCCLVSAVARPCLDAVPIPADTNEVGHFATAFHELWARYCRTGLFKLISYDAGGVSLENATLVRSKGVHYLFGLRGTQPTLRAEAERLLGRLPVARAVAKTVDHTGRGTESRYLFITEEMAGYLAWEHLRTVVRVHSVKRDRAGRLIPQDPAQEDRYYLCSLPRGRLTDDAWLYLIRLHWGVENGCHNTWDKFMREDEHPWIETAPQGMLVVMLLRRMAYNLLTLYRNVTLRSEDKRVTPWRELMRHFYNAFMQLTRSHLSGLRARPGPADAMA